MSDRMRTEAFKNCCRMMYDKQVLLTKVNALFSNLDGDDAPTAMERLQHMFHLSLDGQSASCAAEMFVLFCRLRLNA